MDEIKKIINDLGIESLENNIKIAALAVVSDSGELIYQTENWDLERQTNIILNINKENQSFTLNDLEFQVVETSIEGIIGTNYSGMGHILLVPFQGGVLVSYAMPQVDPPKALAFLKKYSIKLNGKI